MDEADLAILVSQLRMTGSVRQQQALHLIKFAGRPTQIEGKGVPEADPNGAARAAVAAAIIRENRPEDLPLLHILLREEAHCCKEQWGASELLTEIGKAVARFAEPAGLLAIAEGMALSFDCYCALGDEEILRPFNTAATRAFLAKVRAQPPNPKVAKVAALALKYLDETFSD